MTSNCDQVLQSKQAPAGAGPGFFVLAAAVFTAGLALTIYYCRTMSGGMEMPGGWTMSMMWMPMPDQTWFGSTVMFMVMWLAMMVAMMLPSFLPTMLRYHRAWRSENERGVLVSTFLMMAGYFVVWSAAGAVIYVAGIALAMAAMRWITFSRFMPFLIAAAILIAGCMQFMPWTKFGLRECRGPLACGVPSSPKGPGSGWRVGILSGISCVACCSGRYRIGDGRDRDGETDAKARKNRPTLGHHRRDRGTDYDEQNCRSDEQMKVSCRNPSSASCEVFLPRRREVTNEDERVRANSA